MFPLPFLHIVFRFGKCGDDLAITADRVPAAVVKVKMAINDNVYTFGREADRIEILKQLRGLAVDLNHLLGKFVTDSRLDQDVLFASSDQHGIQSHWYEVFFVSTDPLRPQHLGNDAEHASAIEV